MRLRIRRASVQILSLCLLACTYANTPAQTPPKYGPPATKFGKLSRQQILQILTQEADPAWLDQPLKLSDLIGSIQKAGGDANQVKLPIVIDVDAFRRADPDAPPVDETPVKIPGHTRLTIGEVIAIALSQIPTDNASFLVRNGRIDITTDEMAQAQTLLAGRVFAIFEKKPFGEALEELANQTGMTIVLDGRISDKANTPVNGTFFNKSSLEVAVTVLSDMVGAQPILLRDVLYITTPENAERLRVTQQRLKKIAPKKIYEKDQLPPVPPVK